MPKYGNFENLENGCLYSEYKFNLYVPSCRKRVYMQLWELSSNSRFHAQIWKCTKTVHCRKKVYVQLLELLPTAKFHAKYGNFEKRANLLDNTARRAKKSSISTTYDRKRVCATSRTTLCVVTFSSSIVLFMYVLSVRCSIHVLHCDTCT